MPEGNPRPITFDDLEFRVGSNDTYPDNRGGQRCLWVPYLQGDAVYEMFDEWVGDPLNWKTHFEEVTMNGGLAVKCYISIWSPDHEAWVTKEDVGGYSRGDGGGDDASNSIKGGVSDAFKRCASRQWGVGRQVYKLRPVYASCGVNNRGKPIGNAETKGDIFRRLKALDLGFDLAGTGARTRIQGQVESGEELGTEQDDPAPRRITKGRREEAGAAAPTVPLPSEAFMAVPKEKRPIVRAGLEGAGMWPLMPPAEARTEQDRAAAVVAKIEELAAAE